MKRSTKLALSTVLCASACTSPVGEDGGTGGEVCPACLTVWDGGACPAGVVGSVVETDFNHVALGSTVDYNSNPPAGGDHYPYWATWGIHSDVVPTEYFVHNEEHGGLIVLYNCPDGCPDIVSQLTAIVNAQPVDPICVSQGLWVDDAGVPNRMVMTQDPELDVPVAAAGWGWTYKEAAPCVDSISLQAFITAHYGVGRLCSTLPDGGGLEFCEPLCAQGAFQ